MSQFASTRIRPFEKAHRHFAVEQRLLSIITRPDPLAVFCFCAIGLVLTLAALSAFADFSSVMEQIGSVY